MEEVLDAIKLPETLETPDALRKELHRIETLHRGLMRSEVLGSDAGDNAEGQGVFQQKEVLDNQVLTQSCWNQCEDSWKQPFYTYRINTLLSPEDTEAAQLFDDSFWTRIHGELLSKIKAFQEKDKVVQAYCAGHMTKANSSGQTYVHQQALTEKEADAIANSEEPSTPEEKAEQTKDARSSRTRSRSTTGSSAA